MSDEILNNSPEESIDSMEQIRKEIDAQPVSERAILEGMLELMKDERGRRLFLRMISVSKLENTRPLNWSKASIAPYYRKRFAEELKPTIDAMLADPQHNSRIFLYADYNISKKTLHQKTFQAFDFLVREMDTEDFKYRTAREHIVITKEPQGVRLTWAETSKFKEASLVNYGGDSKIKLMEEIEHFLEHAPEGTKFEKTELQLCEEDIQRFENLFVGCSNIYAIVEPARIKLLKCTPEQVQMMKEAT